VTDDTATTAVPVPRTVPEVRRGRERPGWRTLATDAAVLVGLAGLAITQPVLDLFGNNPTFFVAGNYGRRQIVMFALVVASVPAAVAVALSVPFALAGRRAARAAHAVAVAPGQRVGVGPLQLLGRQGPPVVECRLLGGLAHVSQPRERHGRPRSPGHPGVRPRHAPPR